MDRTYPIRSFFSPNIPWRLLSIPFAIDMTMIILYCVAATPLFSFTSLKPGLYVAAASSIICPFTSAFFCLKGSLQDVRRSWREEEVPTCRFSPLLWGAAAFFFGFSQVIWLAQVLIIHRVPDFPTFSHYAELIPFIFLIVGVLLLTTRRITLLLRLRILLDSLIIMSAVATLCIYFILGPLLVKGEGTLQAKIVGGLAPALGLLLMFCVLLVALRSRDRVLRPVLIFLSLATLLQFLADVQHLSELLYHAYNDFSLANIGLILLGLLLVGASQTVNTLLDKGKIVKQSEWQVDTFLGEEARWKAFLPSILVLIFGVLVCALWLHGRQSFAGQMMIVSIGGAIVLVLLLLRQLLTMYQIYMLQRKIEVRNNSLGELNAQLAKQATTDPLTDLPNHRALAEKLTKCLAQSNQEGKACAVIFMDIDHFKEANDRYGHLVGDGLLHSFAQVVKETVRASDTVGRWGGEEFVAILPETGPEEALHVAERIRAAVSQRVSAQIRVPGVTCSLGVAAYPQDAHDQEDLIRWADRAMYAAKRLGRNQTRLAHEPLVVNRRGGTRSFECREKARIAKIAEALLAMVEARDPALSRHARRVAALSLKLAYELGLNQEEAYVASLGGLLHDLGDITMPDELLFKRSRPDEGELEGRACYPRVGAEILSAIPALEPIAEIVGSHYEWLDGSGYPAGLRGEEIPLGARIVAAASAYDAALGEHPTKREQNPASVLRDLRRAAGSHFDPQVIAALERVAVVAPKISRADAAF